MFDGLMGSKFSAKCKQAVKSALARVEMIRKKKKAMLNFLKKDVADLINQGHDQHAFSRMDGVVSESNNIRCYDLIGDYCECIAAHLPVMQKLKSECPPECLEAVATLIFAAARFSDVPELCSLRTLFMERYPRADMESSVSREFIEKVSKHTLSKNGKLKLMQEIAQEHDVVWNLNNFGQKNVPSPAAVQQPKQDLAVTDRREHKPVDGMKHATAAADNVIEQKSLPRQRPESYLKGGNTLSKNRELQHKQEVPATNQKEHKPVDGIRYAAAATSNVEEQRDVLPRHRPEAYLKGSSNAVPKDQDRRQPPAKDQVHVVGGVRSYFLPEAKVLRAEVIDDAWSSSTPQDFRKESRAEGHRDAEFARDDKKNTGRLATGEVEKGNPARDFRASNMAPPYVKARDMAGASWDSKAAAVGQGLDRVIPEKAPERKKDISGAAVDDVKPANRYNRVGSMGPPYVKARHARGASWDEAGAPQQSLDWVTTEKNKTPVGPVREDGSKRALKEVDLYARPSRSTMDDHPNKVTSEDAANRAMPKKEPNEASSPKPPTPAFFRPPPYLKPSNNNNVGNPIDYRKVADMATPVEAGARLHARSTSEVENHPVPDELATPADKLLKPKSVRRNHRKPPPEVIEDAGELLLPATRKRYDDMRGFRSFEDGGVPVNRDDAGRIPDRRKPRYESKEREGLQSHQDAGAGNAYDDAGKIPHERRRPNDRRRRDYAEDVGAVKAVHDDAATVPPVVKYQQNDRRGLHNVDDEVDDDQKIDWLLMHYSRKGMPERQHQIKRVASLPHEDSPKAVRVPARAASSLTDEPSPNGGTGRRQLPDYDELAARFNALKRS